MTLALISMELPVEKQLTWHFHGQCGPRIFHSMLVPQGRLHDCRGSSRTMDLRFHHSNCTHEPSAGGSTHQPPTLFLTLAHISYSSLACMPYGWFLYTATLRVSS